MVLKGIESLSKFVGRPRDLLKVSVVVLVVLYL